MSSDVEVTATPDGSGSRAAVTARAILAHLGGILAALNLAGAIFFGTMLPAAMFAVALCVSFPAVKRHTEALLSASISTPASVVIYLSMTLIGNFLFFVQTAA